MFPTTTGTELLSSLVFLITIGNICNLYEAVTVGAALLFSPLV